MKPSAHPILNAKDSESAQGYLTWWQLSLLGVGCTIGTGYFLGTGIGLKVTGPSMVISFLLAAWGTYMVFHLLAQMTTADPQEGSFCYYAGKACGRWARFGCGWNYWTSTVLIMGSQLTALAILSQFWFPGIPLWMFASLYSILSIGVMLLGSKGFDKVEHILAVTKTAAIVIFIILAGAALIGWIPGDGGSHPGIPGSMKDLFPYGLRGFWSSLLYAFYAYGGVEVIGLMAMQLKNKEEAPKAGQAMLLALTIIYVISIGLVILMVSHEAVSEKESPFVTALASYHLSFFPHVFNGAIIIAGFSTMTASLFAVTNLLVMLAHNGDAPQVFEKKIKSYKNLPLPSLALAALGLAASVITALFLPGTIYAYLTTAAGILQMYNWGIILFSANKLLKLTVKDKLFSLLSLLLVAAAVSGTLVEKSIRFGFIISILLLAIIAFVTWIMTRIWRRSGQEKKQSSY
ncbi:amino acid permease [Paenibacillus puerhi]|uniref:amino acid permease n=1 Tax=Paenibacillus puerhi TaxID=2692622 RepID=UPI001356CA89|nr:amino acid permease [Paenibacillus puerhi]